MSAKRWMPVEYLRDNGRGKTTIIGLCCKKQTKNNLRRLDHRKIDLSDIVRNWLTVLKFPQTFNSFGADVWLLKYLP